MGNREVFIQQPRKEKLCRRDKDKEIKQLKEDIKKMYDEEVIISILGDEFNISRNEALSLLEGGEE